MFKLSYDLFKVPWITIEGIHTEDMQQKAQTDLVALICSSYQVSLIKLPQITFKSDCL